MKPIELIGVLVGLAGLGVGAYALLRRPATPPPPAATVGAPVTTSTQLPSYGRAAPGQGTASTGNDFMDGVNAFAGAAATIAPAVMSLVDFFGSL